MRVPAKAKRPTKGNHTNVNFDDYDWSVEPEPGWNEGVVIKADEGTSKAGNEMITLVFGIESRSDLPGAVGGRVSFWVHDYTIDEVLACLAPEQNENEEAFDLTPKSLMFKRCALLIEEDVEYQRRDGRKSYKVEKLATLEAAAGELAAAGEGDDSDDEDLI